MEREEGREGTHPSPSVDGRLAVADVGGDLGVVAEPVPDLDVLLRALHGVPAAADGVELRPVAVLLGRVHAAALVVGGVGVAVRAGAGPVGRAGVSVVLAVYFNSRGKR